MNRGQKILIIGASMLVVGIVLIAIPFTMTGGSYYFMSSTETISPGQSSDNMMDATEGENMTVMLDVQPSTVPMGVVVAQIVPEDRSMVQRLANGNFSGDISLSFTPINDEEINIFIFNRGHQQATVNMVAGTGEFFDDAEPGKLPTPNVVLGTIAVIGPFLTFVGFIVLIVGAIIWIVDKVRMRRRTAKE